MLRAALFEALGVLAHDERVLEQSRRILAGEVEVDPATADAAVRVVAGHADTATFDDFLARSKAATTPQDTLRYLGALADVDDPALFSRFLDLLLGPDVRTQDAGLLLNRALTNRVNAATAWAFATSHWDELIERLPTNAVSRMITGVRTFHDAALAAQVEAFLEAHPVPQAARAFRAAPRAHARHGRARRTRAGAAGRRPVVTRDRRPPSGPTGPLRWSVHRAVATGLVPTLPELRHALRPPGDHPVARRVEVFAVEPHGAQVTWSALGPGPVRFRVADTIVDVATDGGPGAVELSGLPEGSNLRLEVSGDGVPERRRTLAFRTPLPPPGDECYRFATISDLHVGEATFGYLHTITDDDLLDPHPVRCTRAAIAEAAAWGAQRLLVKGDVVDQAHPAPWQVAGELLAAAPMPVDIIPGNHEKKRRRTIDAGVALGRVGLDVVEGVATIDVPGLRIVLLDSAQIGDDRGRLAHLQDELAATLRSTSGGALVAMHHQVQRGVLPTSYPLGVPHDEGRRVLDSIATAHPATFITSGHVHRNRRWHHGPLVLTTVGSVKDYPGVWGGYVVHEGGIRQVTRRVAEPAAIGWTERSGDARLRRLPALDPRPARRSQLQLDLAPSDLTVGDWTRGGGSE